MGDVVPITKNVLQCECGFSPTVRDLGVSCPAQWKNPRVLAIIVEFDCPQCQQRIRFELRKSD